MGRAATGQAALRDSPPAAAASAPATADHGDTPGDAPSTRSAAAPGAAALAGILEGRLMLVTGRENGLLLRRTCLTVAAPPRKAPTPSGEVRLGSKR